MNSNQELSPTKVREYVPTSKRGVPAPVHFPLEYNGEKLDNRPQALKFGGHFYQIDPKAMALVWEHIEERQVLDLSEFQQIMTIDTNTKRKRQKSLGIYHRSDQIGRIDFTGSWAKLTAFPSQNPQLTDMMIDNIIDLLEEYFQPDNTQAERLIPSDKNVDIGVKGQSALINLDKLNLKLEVPDLSWLTGCIYARHYRIKCVAGGGTGYTRKAEVFLKNRKIGTLLWDSSWKNLEGTARYEIENAELYDTLNTSTFRSEIVDSFCKLMNAKVIGVFRADIAIDSVGVLTFLQSVHHREIVATRQKTYWGAKKYVGLATDEIEGFGFGSRQSGRYIRVYNKSKEIRDGRASKGLYYKAHIVEFHSANGLPEDQDIGRLEVELLWRFLKTVEGFEWYHLFDRLKLVELFKTALDKYFEWVPADHSDSKVNRRERVEIVDFAQLKTSKYERGRPSNQKTDRMQKIIAKRLVVEAAFLDDDCDVDNAWKAAEDIVDRHCLWNWFRLQIPKIGNEIRILSVELGREPNEVWCQRLFDFSDYCIQRVQDNCREVSASQNRARKRILQKVAA
ncbi:MAG: hypothetical protein AAF741_02905 [Bacteroidota bacterium]